ncbi:FkbM family methyltransferase [Antarctobacter sp.]|uniref:FkbM family methyltransferase n=1 Tax=Antarctobacter sp. TaxID=1872577 RepID=UPI002B2792A2|nr:FkbM family methyltransferase [Antarctobacter sp.]
MEFEHRICVNEYGFYCVPDAYAKREIPKILSQGGVYEPNTLSLMARRALGGDIVTGGAFIGDFFPALARAVAPGSRVVSFEPNPLSFAAAQRTIALNGLGNVDLAPVAVGETSGTLHLQLAREGGSATAARAKIVETADEGETVPVEVVTLDDLCPADRIVSILHLDVEGHEKPALLGARRMIEQNAPMIVLEADRPWQRGMYAEFLAEQFPGQGYVMCGGMERNVFFIAQG